MTDCPHAAGSQTSLAAAQRMRYSARDLRALVFAAVHRAGIHGLTRQEIEAETGLAGNTVRPRVLELIHRGLVTTSDEVRPSTSHRSCEVLVSTTLPKPGANTYDTIAAVLRAAGSTTGALPPPPAEPVAS